MAAAASLSILLGATVVAYADDGPYEQPPAQAPASLLPPAMVSDADFHVVDPVTGDGLMNHYVIESRFGQFEAYGRVMLGVRIREVHALAQLAKTSTAEVVVGAVGRGVVSQVDTVTGIATRPVQTVTGIPRGIVHLFQGYKSQADEALEQTRKVAGAAGPGASGGESTVSSVAEKGTSAAKAYADKYVGVSAAERRWYQKLGVDPYTSNSALRDAIHRTANVEAVAGVGTRFVGLPQIPGIDIARRAQDAIYNEDPATMRARTRATLLGYGLEPGEIDRYQHSAVFNPTRQVVLYEAAGELKDVDGRAELFRHALSLTSDVEAQVYLQSVGVLLLAHRERPVAAILPGVRLPAARRADGSVLICGAFDAVYWTQGVATRAQELRASLAALAPSGLEVWLSGTASPLAHDALAQLGWQVHDAIGAAVEPGAPAH